MGYKALSNPIGVVSVFDLETIPPAMQNEVAAIYGGFGFAFGLSLLIANFRNGPVATGVLLALGVLTLGMAAGRMVAFCFVQPENRFPLLFMCLEIVMGGALVAMALMRLRFSRELSV